MTKATHPYADLPDHCFWTRSHRDRTMAEVDPVIKAGFTLTQKMKIATAGSCFAQHIARHLKGHGFNYLVTETAHPMISSTVAAQFNYGTFTARFGNLYTARQLLQLAQRAYGTFVPVEDVWEMEDGSFVDPYRPNIQEGGFSTRANLEIDRHQHFAAVRQMLEEADVFVFTFGLTESWQNLEDGAVFPLAPGVAGGNYDPARHGFINFTVSETIADFTAFADILRKVNPKVKILMTVSPVPLIATARADESVISATAYSKSVLRVACEDLRSTLRDCYYFPSYEVITGISTRGAYYGADLREIEANGVAHAMSLFMRHYTNKTSTTAVAKGLAVITSGFHDRIEQALDIICDEEMIERATR